EAGGIGSAAVPSRFGDGSILSESLRNAGGEKNGCPRISGQGTARRLRRDGPAWSDRVQRGPSGVRCNGIGRLALGGKGANSRRWPRQSWRNQDLQDLSRGPGSRPAYARQAPRDESNRTRGETCSAHLSRSGRAV